MLRHAERPHAGDQTRNSPSVVPVQGRAMMKSAISSDERQPLPVEQRVGEHLAAAEAAAALHDAVERAPHVEDAHGDQRHPDHDAGGARLPDEVGGGREVVAREPAGEQGMMKSAAGGHERDDEVGGKRLARIGASALVRIVGHDVPPDTGRGGLTLPVARRTPAFWHIWRALRDSNPCYRRERAASWTARRRAREAPRHIESFAGAGKQRGRRAVSPARWARRRYQCPVFGIDFQGSLGGSAAPFCNSSIECLSGERTNAMVPSRGGRLMVTPAFISRSHTA